MITNTKATIYRMLLLVVALLTSTAVAQTLTVAHSVFPATLNPLMTTVAAEESVALAIIEKLVVFEPEAMQPVPWLLESWAFKSDTELLLTLRDGISFSNGEPVDAAAVRFSLETWRRQPVMAHSIVGLEDAAFEIVDDLNLLIRTSRPVVNLINTLARYGYVVPPAYYSEVGDDGFARAPIGSGPYVLASQDAGSRVVLERNPGYWRGEPGFQQVVFRAMSDDFSRAAAIEAGEADIAYLLSDTSLARLRNTPGVTVHSIQGLRKFIAAFNANMPGGEPLQDPRVRQALNHAVDVQTIVDIVFDGEATALGGAFATSGEFGYSKVAAFEYDTEQAKKLLAEAGYPNGFPITLAYTAGRYPKDQEVGEILSSYLSAVGLTVTQRPLEWGQFAAERSAKTLGQIYAFGLLFPPDLGETFKYMAFATDAPMIDWPDEWLQLYSQSETAVVPEDRAQLYGEMLEINRQNPFGIYLFSPNDAYATRSTVTGFQPRQDQVLLLYDVRPSN